MGPQIMLEEIWLDTDIVSKSPQDQAQCQCPRMLMWHTFGHQERAAGSKQGAEYLELLEHSPHGLCHRQPGAHMPPTVPGKADMEDHKVTLDVCGCRLCDNKKSDDSYVVLESRLCGCSLGRKDQVHCLLSVLQPPLDSNQNTRRNIALSVIACMCHL